MNIINGIIGFLIVTVIGIIGLIVIRLVLVFLRSVVGYEIGVVKIGSGVEIVKQVGVDI